MFSAVKQEETGTCQHLSTDNKCVNRLANSISDNLSTWVCDLFQLSHDRREKLACIFYLQLPHHWLLVIRDAAEVVAGPSWKELEPVKVFSEQPHADPATVQDHRLRGH